jgi:predicted  nucleic acid-binding Zn-ribbon protein
VIKRKYDKMRIMIGEQALKCEIEILKKENEKLEQHNKDLDRANTNLQLKIGKLKKQAWDCEASRWGLVKDYEQFRIASLTSENIVLQKQLDNSKEKVTYLKNNVSELYCEINKNTVTINNLKREVASLRKTDREKEIHKLKELNKNLCSATCCKTTIGIPEGCDIPYRSPKCPMEDELRKLLK